MAYKLKGKGSDGHCCCGIGNCIIHCGVRGGIARLVGLSEFGTPSVPPQLYRTGQKSGTSLGDLYNSSDCTSFNHSDGCTYTSRCAYDRVTGVLTLSGGTQCEVGGIDDPPIPPDCSPFVAGCGSSLSQTKTQQILSATSECCGPQSSQYRKSSGSANFLLSDPDLEVDAINRIPGINVWSDYAPCTTGLCCRTTRQIRGANQYSFEYLESRFKVVVTALPANADILVRTDILRRTYGVGSYELYQTMENNGRSDSTGRAEIIFGVIENTAGYETVASNCRAELS